MRSQKKEQIKTFLLTEDNDSARRRFALDVLAALEPDVLKENQLKLDLHSWFFMGVFCAVMILQGSLIYTTYPVLSTILFTVLLLVGHFLGGVLQKGKMTGFLIANVFALVFILFSVEDLLYFKESSVGPWILGLSIFFLMMNNTLFMSFFTKREVTSFLRIYFGGKGDYSFILQEESEP